MQYIKQIATLVLSITLPSAAISAADIKGVTAGNLKTIAANVSPEETSLTISGSMNAADFSFIQDTFTKLQNLNLQDVTILAYNGNKLPYTGLNSSPYNVLPDYSLTGIGSLTSITLPKNLGGIGKGALSGTGITEVNIPESVTSIGEYAFLRCNDLRQVVIPVGVSTIGKRAFANCGKLNMVVFSTNGEGTKLEKIPEGLFEACGGLTNIDLTALANCTEIGAWSFAECNGLSTLILPESLQEIGESALSGDNCISVLLLPEELYDIKANAMAGMTGLQTINASNVVDVPALGDNVWRNVNQANVTLVAPDALIGEFRSTDQWKEFRIMDQDKYESSTDNIINTVGTHTLNITRNGDILTISSEEPLEKVSIFNVSGRAMLTVAHAGSSASVNVSKLTPGVYLVVTPVGVAKITI